MGAECFLVGGVGWLEEEDGLGGEEEGGYVEEGVGGEGDEGVDEYGGVDCGCELWGGRVVSGGMVNGEGRGRGRGGGRTIQMPAWAIMAVPVGWEGGLVFVTSEWRLGGFGGSGYTYREPN